MIRVKLSKDAANYIRKETEYLGRYSQAAARRFSQEMREAKRLLQTFPEAGNRMHGLLIAGDRTLVAGDYLLDYSYDGHQVDIRLIRHGRTVVQTPDLEEEMENEQDWDDENGDDPKPFG
ncbi:MAG: type II toxin-antitoxin system RelE/ParE family toxin [Shinella zoogloeoides]|uniref:type II toxin-antitoxin system RelE/ParE family toxin n=1 Tax=Shinella zoogloeoides TaxID=352475 RepID=UPI003C7523E4